MYIWKRKKFRDQLIREVYYNHFSTEHLVILSVDMYHERYLGYKYLENKKLIKIMEVENGYLLEITFSGIDYVENNNLKLFKGTSKWLLKKFIVYFYFLFCLCFSIAGVLVIMMNDFISSSYVVNTFSIVGFVFTVLGMAGIFYSSSDKNMGCIYTFIALIFLFYALYVLVNLEDIMESHPNMFNAFSIIGVILTLMGTLFGYIIPRFNNDEE
ncbi:hypothetical protein [Aneurinibacillus uraniidurans]|uniref:hypothetical protein n=1 Tax=Aneurinibacillus uraniidurans TaxID=2966586 RepID=UPI00234B5B86|nr:hypothetical protein [Aneurinibacillus sp. B1]WCN36516.1 hypothetical protein PO771_11560 [Aneurinibacillus sp. B1]